MGDANAAIVRHHLTVTLRRWRLIAALTAVGTVLAVMWTVATAGPTWTATSALTAQSGERAPEQDGVLALGYVNYFNQDSYQQVLRSEADLPADITLSAEIAAISPILYVHASGDDESAARAASAAAADRFREDVRASLQAERGRQIEDLQGRVDELSGTLSRPGVNDGIVLDQIRSLQGRITDLAATTTNQLNELQSEPGVEMSGSDPILTIAAGVFGGAVVGVLIALLLGVLDQRVRTASDVRVRAGLDPVLDIVGDSDGPGARRQLGNLMNAASLVNVTGPVVLAVVSPRSGSVAPALARRLAALATGRRMGALLVEADLHGASRRAAGLADLLDRLGDARALIVRERSGLGLIGPGDLRGRTPDCVVDPDRMAETVAELAAAAGTVVLQAPPLLEAAESQIVCAAADRVVLVIERDVTSVRDVTDARTLLEAVRAPLSATVVLDGGEIAPELTPAPVEDVESPTDALPPRNGFRGEKGESEQRTNDSVVGVPHGWS